MIYRLIILTLLLALAPLAGIAGAPTIDTLEKALGERVTKIPEFEFIREEAKKLGVRAWLFGGTAAGYAHYVKWDLLREGGDAGFQGERFDYDYTNIYRATQDLDIVIDGNARQASALQQALKERYPHFQGSKEVWEVRLLNQSMGDKLAILNNPDFLNQHSDSNSTGLIEITEPRQGEAVVRDARDWESRRPHFLKDVHEGKLHYYFSPEHENTLFAKQGRNPPILSVIRYLTKAFQYQLELRQEDLDKVKKIIDDFNPGGPELNNAYVQHWLLRKDNGRKLFQNAVNIEYAWNTLEKLGLRQKLIQIEGKGAGESTLAWWMSKEPLRTRPVGEGSGRTARELGIDVVAHETNTLAAYESITRAHTGEPNVLISRQGIHGEAAVYGEGFYTRVGREGARSTGLTIRFHLHPDARQGTDFILENGDYVIVRNKAALRVIPESFDWTPAEYTRFRMSGGGIKLSDRGLEEKLKRRVRNFSHALSPAQASEVGGVAIEFLEKATKPEEILRIYRVLDDMPAAQKAFDQELRNLPAEKYRALNAKLHGFAFHKGGNDLFSILPKYHGSKNEDFAAGALDRAMKAETIVDLEHLYKLVETPPELLDGFKRAFAAAPEDAFAYRRWMLVNLQSESDRFPHELLLKILQTHQAPADQRLVLEALRRKINFDSGQIEGHPLSRLYQASPLIHKELLQETSNLPAISFATALKRLMSESHHNDTWSSWPLVTLLDQNTNPAHDPIFREFFYKFFDHAAGDQHVGRQEFIAAFRKRVDEGRLLATTQELREFLKDATIDTSGKRWRAAFLKEVIPAEKLKALAAPELFEIYLNKKYEHHGKPAFLAEKFFTGRSYTDAELAEMVRLQLEALAAKKRYPFSGGLNILDAQLGLPRDRVMAALVAELRRAAPEQIKAAIGGEIPKEFRSNDMIEALEKAELAKSHPDLADELLSRIARQSHPMETQRIARQLGVPLTPKHLGAMGNERLFYKLHEKTDDVRKFLHDLPIQNTAEWDQAINQLLNQFNTRQWHLVSLLAHLFETTPESAEHHHLRDFLLARMFREGRYHGKLIPAELRENYGKIPAILEYPNAAWSWLSHDSHPDAEATRELLKYPAKITDKLLEPVVFYSDKPDHAEMRRLLLDFLLKEPERFPDTIFDLLEKEQHPLRAELLSRIKEKPVPFPNELIENVFLKSKAARGHSSRNAIFEREKAMASLVESAVKSGRDVEPVVRRMIDQEFVGNLSPMVIRALQLPEFNRGRQVALFALQEYYKNSEPTLILRRKQIHEDVAYRFLTEVLSQPHTRDWTDVRNYLFDHAPRSMRFRFPAVDFPEKCQGWYRAFMNNHSSLIQGAPNP